MKRLNFFPLLFIFISLSIITCDDNEELDDNFNCVEDYISIPDYSVWQGAKWEVAEHEWDGFDEKCLVYKYDRKYELLDDTAINSQIYKKLRFHEKRTVEVNDGFIAEEYKEQNRVVGYLREDYCKKQVYFLKYGSENESLIYDFSLKLGDTVNSYFCSNPNTIYTISDTFSIDIGNELHRAFKVSAFDGNGTLNNYYTYIEGVGCSHGIVELDIDPPYLFNDEKIYLY